MRVDFPGLPPVFVPRRRNSACCQVAGYFAGDSGAASHRTRTRPQVDPCKGSPARPGPPQCCAFYAQHCRPLPVIGAPGPRTVRAPPAIQQGLAAQAPARNVLGPPSTRSRRSLRWTLAGLRLGLPLEQRTRGREKDAAKPLALLSGSEEDRIFVRQPAVGDERACCRRSAAGSAVPLARRAGWKKIGATPTPFGVAMLARVPPARRCRPWFSESNQGVSRSGAWRRRPSTCVGCSPTAARTRRARQRAPARANCDRRGAGRPTATLRAGASEARFRVGQARLQAGRKTEILAVFERIHAVVTPATKRSTHWGSATWEAGASPSADRPSPSASVRRRRPRASERPLVRDLG